MENLHYAAPEGLPPIVGQKTEAIRQLCQRFAVRQLYVFGSVLTARFGKKSDLDFLVDFDEPADPIEFGLLLIEFEKQLAQLFGRKVDVVVDRYVHNPFFRKKLDSTKILVYDRRS